MFFGEKCISLQGIKYCCYETICIDFLLYGYVCGRYSGS